MKICVYGAASSLIDNHYIEAGIELGKELAKRGHGLVFGGGSHGMMGALAEGTFEEKGELVIKVVNGADTAYLTTIQIKGSKNIAEEGRVISLTAADGSEENSFEEPRKIYPKEIAYKGFGPEFDYEFPPFSYTILRVKAEKQ